MAATPKRGEVWLVDLGMVAKVRPCLVLSVPADDENDRVLVTLAPHTTSVRDSRFEVRSDVRFLKPGAFDAQNLVTIPAVKLIRVLGALPADQLASVEAAVKRWLGFDSDPKGPQN
ncbi:MAG: type II toxin-antitoxin system PemK/MazF family toxin [Planctomycetota bacterium]